VFVFGTDGGRHHPGAPAVSRMKDGPAAGPAASAYSEADSTAVFAAIANRAKDPKPLTSAEAFTPKKITDTDAHASLKLTASSLHAPCVATVWGDELLGLLRRGACTQAARAAYEDKHFGALVTIFNMADERAADQVVAAADPKGAKGFPLVPSKASPF